MKIIDNLEISFREEELLENPPFSQWIKSTELGEKLKESVHELRGNVLSNLDPRAIYGIFRRGETDVMEYSPPKPILEAELLAVAIVTIGEPTDEIPGENSLLKDLVVDGLENFALYQSVKRVVEFIKREAEEDGLKTTRVIFPGGEDIDWGTKNNEFIFKNLVPGKIGVRLTSSYTIKPSKSVSFVMGLGDNIEQAEDLFSWA